MACASCSCIHTSAVAAVTRVSCSTLIRQWVKQVRSWPVSASPPSIATPAGTGTETLHEKKAVRTALTAFGGKANAGRDNFVCPVWVFSPLSFARAIDTHVLTCGRTMRVIRAYPCISAPTYREAVSPRVLSYLGATTQRALRKVCEMASRHLALCAAKGQ